MATEQETCQVYSNTKTSSRLQQIKVQHATDSQAKLTKKSFI